jgi:hypothetical protein
MPETENLPAKITDSESSPQSLPTVSESGAVSESNPEKVLAVILSMARDDSLDIQKLQVLLDMQHKMEVRQGEISFSRDLAQLAAKMPQIPKNGRVSLGEGKGSYPFAKWEDMDKIIRPLMAEFGFVLGFDSMDTNTGIRVTGILSHKDGHSRSASMTLQLDSGPGRNTNQAMGSTLSYGKRYTAEMLLNIVREGEDTDGKKSGVKAPQGFGKR